MFFKYSETCKAIANNLTTQVDSLLHQNGDCK